MDSEVNLTSCEKRTKPEDCGLNTFQILDTPGENSYFWSKGHCELSWEVFGGADESNSALDDSLRCRSSKWVHLREVRWSWSNHQVPRWNTTQRIQKSTRGGGMCLILEKVPNPRLWSERTPTISVFAVHVWKNHAFTPAHVWLLSSMCEWSFFTSPHQLTVRTHSPSMYCWFAGWWWGCGSQASFLLKWGVWWCSLL